MLDSVGSLTESCEENRKRQRDDTRIEQRSSVAVLETI